MSEETRSMTIPEYVETRLGALIQERQRLREELLRLEGRIDEMLRLRPTVPTATPETEPVKIRRKRG